MSEWGLGPQGRRKGRGARERILGAVDCLFRVQGINTTGMDEVCSVAKVSKPTAYRHFASKDELTAEYVRLLAADKLSPERALEREGLPLRQRLSAIFITPRISQIGTAPMHDGQYLGCPFINAAAEITDPAHPVRALVRDHKRAFTKRLVDTAREAGAENPELLGEQLALLYDGAAARARAVGTDTGPTAESIADILIERALGAGGAGSPS